MDTENKNKKKQDNKEQGAENWDSTHSHERQLNPYDTQDMQTTGVPRQIDDWSGKTYAFQ